VTRKRTYVDSGVLIAAMRGGGGVGQHALEVISDTASREFVCSDYVRLEVIPKPTYEGRAIEVKFYEEFFALVSVWLPFDLNHLQRAFIEACDSGLKAMDAIHVVAAADSRCDELVTSEKPGKSIHRTKLITVISIDAD